MYVSYRIRHENDLIALDDLFIPFLSKHRLSEPKSQPPSFDQNILVAASSCNHSHAA
jgi:hypothetical protein